MSTFKNLKYSLTILLFSLVTAGITAQTCDPIPVTTGTSIVGSRTGLIGLCLLCSVNSTANVTNSNLTDNGNISITAGLVAGGAISVNLGQTFPAGTEAGFALGTSGLNVTVLSGIQIQTYFNGALQQQASGSSLLTLGGSGSATAVGFVTNLPFNEVRVVVNSVVGLLANVDVYWPYVRNACFNFGGCSTATFTGTFVQGTASTGTLVIPISSTKGGNTTFAVSGGGFSVTPGFAPTLTAGQTSVTIPISYDGTGTIGNIAVTTSSPNGTGTCNTTITVVSPICGGSAPTVSSTSTTNVCPSTTANLTVLPNGTVPSGAVLSWHTGSTATGVNVLATPTAVSAGTYYLAFRDTNNNCYSPTRAISVTNTFCCSIPNCGTATVVKN